MVAIYCYTIFGRGKMYLTTTHAFDKIRSSIAQLPTPWLRTWV